MFPAMTTDEMKARTKALALRVMKMTDHLPGGRKAQVLSDQILRSAMSVAANYRAACRGRSAAEFTAKLGIAVEEADETCLWLEFDNRRRAAAGEQIEIPQIRSRRGDRHAVLRRPHHEAAREELAPLTSSILLLP
jgi:four helix bundle protein